MTVPTSGARRRRRIGGVGELSFERQSRGGLSEPSYRATPPRRRDRRKRLQRRVLLHGWPTSSFLWRNVLGPIDIAHRLLSLEVPVHAVYGERDRILPDVARTMERLQRDLPQARVTALADCGHFLQEERPLEVGRLLAELFNAS